MAPDQSSDSKGKPATQNIIFQQFLHRDAKLSKLKTSEDGHHIHKTLGILAVLSFIYRYGYVYPRQGTLGFDGRAFDWASVIVHTLLACSSILFRVPAERLKKSPMVIYEEYRQHAILFTVRSFSTCALGMLLPNQAYPAAYIAPVLIMAHHLVADRITAIHGTGNTSVRADGEKIKENSTFKYLAWFYSLYQFMLIGSLVENNARAADLGYNGIIAIQSSAFLMTLYRKRIIRGRTHFVVYSLCLVLSWFHILRLVGLEVAALILGTFALRVALPRAYSNKYALWCVFLLTKYRNAVQDAVAAGGDPDLLKAVGVAAMIFVAYHAERALFGSKNKKEKEK